MSCPECVPERREGMKRTRTGDSPIPVRAVIYQADEWGYTVAVVEEGRIVHEYSATNNPLDSQGPVLAEGVSLETLQRWAEQTAREIAEEWGTDLIGPDEDMRRTGRGLFQSGVRLRGEME